MKNLRKKTVALAIASAMGGAMLAGSAMAMNVSQQGVGEVILFPYYTVRNGFDTYVHITNTSAYTTTFKIRFREALNSREVRDFNVVLSPYDVWTATVSVNGGGTGAVLKTSDTSCTSPHKTNTTYWTNVGNDAQGRPVYQTNFVSSGYDGTAPSNYPYDNGGKSLSRTQEGYLEVIEMAISTLTTGDSYLTAENAPVEYNAKHVNGVPRNCARVDEAFTSAGLEVDWDTFSAPENVLKGYGTLIDVADGRAFEINPTHIEDFQNSSTILYEPGDLLPDLRQGEVNPTAMRFVDGSYTQFTGQGQYVARSVDAVSALLAQTAIMNEYTAAAAQGTGTDWVITFPTKHYYSDRRVSDSPSAFPPFATNFTLANGKSCNTIHPTTFDREENEAAGEGNQMSPAPEGGTLELCYEVNVFTFNDSNVLANDAINHKGWDTTAIGTKGWVHMGLDQNGTHGTFLGLPVIGFAAIERTAASIGGNYANTEEHIYQYMMQ